MLSLNRLGLQGFLQELKKGKSANLSIAWLITGYYRVNYRIFVQYFKFGSISRLNRLGLKVFFKNLKKGTSVNLSIAWFNNRLLSGYLRSICTVF